MTNDRPAHPTLSAVPDRTSAPDPPAASLDAIEQALQAATNITARLELLARVLRVLAAPDQDVQDGTSYRARTLERLQALGPDIAGLEALLATRPALLAAPPPSRGEDHSGAACPPTPPSSGDQGRP